MIYLVLHALIVSTTRETNVPVQEMRIELLVYAITESALHKDYSEILKIVHHNKLVILLNMRSLLA